MQILVVRSGVAWLGVAWRGVHGMADDRHQMRRCAIGYLPWSSARSSMTLQ